LNAALLAEFKGRHADSESVELENLDALKLFRQELKQLQE